MERGLRTFFIMIARVPRRMGRNRIRQAAQPDNEKMPAFSPLNTLKKSSYILCTEDKVVNPASQKRYGERFGFLPSQIKTLTSGHSPFLSKAEELALLLKNFI